MLRQHDGDSDFGCITYLSVVMCLSLVLSVTPSKYNTIAYALHLRGGGVKDKIVFVPVSRI
uniref:Uncharacterized protein n=1 Tax=Arundo donax TaxID=35708 RepID=A0A0A8XQ73_ARUDO